MVFKENKFQKNDKKTRCDVASGFLYLREWKFFSIEKYCVCQFVKWLRFL